MKKQNLSAFAAAVWDGDSEIMQNTLTDILYDTISYHDSAESFYHGFMAGLLRGAGFVLGSNRESGLGRTDIAIVDGRNKRAVIIELKYAKEYGDLESRAEEALVQIEEKKYAAGLPPNIRTVINYGIAFWKKECCVKTACRQLTHE